MAHAPAAGYGTPTMMRNFQPSIDEQMFHRRTNRLSPDVYTSPGRFSITICTARRHRLCAPTTVAHLRDTLFGAAAYSAIQLDVYCFMPDHLHLLVTSHGTDVRMFLKRFKQQSAYWFRQSAGGELWQKGYYDHVLRSDEDTERVAEYILDNPVRSGLCRIWDEYPHSWSRWHS
jgi:REP element-mobilizing transposase RayT